MKKFLLFWFTAAFLLASVSTFAQSGKPVKVTNDKQLQAAMANPAVTQMELAGGFYPSQSLEAGDGTLLTKGSGSNKGPGDCNYFITPTSYCFTGAPSAGQAVAGTTGPLCTVLMVGTWSYTTADGGTLTWTDGTPTDYTENFTVNQAGTYTLTYTWTTGSGAPAGTKVTSDWYFYPQPAAVITTAAEVCGLTTTFDVDFDFGTVTMPSTPSITWTLDGVSFTGPTSDATGQSLTVASCGTKVLKVAIDFGPCSTVEVQKTIKFYDDPTAAAGDDKTTCGLSVTLTPGTPTASCLNGGTIGTAWSQVSGPGTASFVGNVATVDQCGTYVFRYTTTNGVCTNTDDVEVKYYDTPAGGTAGTDFGVCGLSTTMVPTPYTVSCVNGGTLTHGWAITGSAPGTATFTGNGVVVSSCGTYTFRYTATNGDCSTFDDVTVKFYDTPDADAGTDKSTCGLSVTLTPGTPSVSCLNGGSLTTGWTKTAGPGTASFSGNTATVTECGTYEFTYTVTNGECVDTDVVEVKYYDTPAGGNAGVDKEFCGLSGALTPTDYTVSCTNGGTLGHAWTKVAGTGTATFTGNNVEVSQCGTFTFRYTATNGDCSAYDDVIVKFFDTPVANAGSDTEVCGLVVNLIPTATANCQNSATLIDNWALLTGPALATMTADSNELTVSVCGEYQFTYTVQNGPCSDVDTVTVKFFSTPTGVTAGTDDTKCGLTYNLTPDYAIACGTLGTPVIGWTKTAGPGTATFTGSDKTWSVTVSECGEYTFEYSVDNGPCAPVTAAVTIKFFDTPTGTSAGTDADVCGLAKTLSPTLGTVSCDHGTAPTGAWSLFTGAGTASITGNNVTVSACGSYTFRYTTTNGPCSQYDDVVIRFFDAPVGTSAGSDAEVCGLGASLTPVQGTVSCDFGETRVNTWSKVSGPGLVTFVGNSVTVDACGEYVFQYKSANGPCEATDNVTVKFHSEPTIAFDAEPANVCGYTTSFYYSFDADCFKATYAGAWTYLGPVGGIATLNTTVAGTLGISVDKCGSYDFIYTVTNGICTVDDTVTIRFYETPNPQITGELNVYTCSTVTYTVVDGRTCDFGGLKHLWTVSGGTISGSATGTSVTVDWNQYTGTGTITVTSELADNAGCVASESATATKIAPTFAGQVKYWNAFETYMPTPFPTDFYGTFPEDYFYVTLYKINGPTMDSLETKLVEPRLTEDLVELMSSFEFTLPVASDGCDVDYVLKIWDGGLSYHHIFGGPVPPTVSGTYLGESYTYTNWGGGNATDALALQLMVGNATNINASPYNYAWVGINTLGYGYYSKSIGDVNMSGSITALDALTLNYRAVGLIGSFPNSIPGKQYSPNFKVTGRMVDTLPEITFPDPFYSTNVKDVPFTHSGASYLYFTPATSHKYTSSVIPWEGKKNYMNIYYTATGDINSSYVPTSAGFKAEPAMSLILEGEQAVNAGDVVTIPVRVDRNSELGAITLGLSYRNDLVEVIGTNYGADFAKIDTEKSLINIGWFSTDGINVSENEAIAYITVRVLANIEKGTSLFTLQANTEFADRSANVIEGVNLKSTAVYTGKTGSELNATNYPNPFSNTTTISYNLPEAGNVQIAIFNKLGQSVRTLVDGMQSAGAHTFELANANLQPGVYQYRITLTGKNGSYSVVKSMIVVE